MQLTVAQLIEKLQAIPNQDLPVATEGCDCLGEATDVVIEPGTYFIKHEFVLITRNQEN